MIQELSELSWTSKFIRTARACQRLYVRQVNLNTRESKAHILTCFPVDHADDPHSTGL